MVYYNVERTPKEVCAMKLTLEQIKSACTGAVSVEQEGDGVHFYRFTREQMTLCQPHAHVYARKILAAAGVRLSFRTDSRTLFLRAGVSQGCIRSYFSFDLAVNGEYIDSMDNFSHLEIPELHATLSCAMGEYEKVFDLGPGEKDVCLYFPWSVVSVVQELSVDDGASFVPVLPGKTLLAFGDSITQGFDILRPFHHHVARLARELGAQEFNKAIGGTIAFPEMARMKDEIDPDYILVGYGTNDWGLSDEAFFAQQYRAMLEAICDNYPGVPVFAITPIWRTPIDEIKQMGPFFTMEKNICAIAADFPDVTVISGLGLVPHEARYYADGCLHPNDAGFDHYFQNLWPQIKAALKG